MKQFYMVQVGNNGCFWVAISIKVI